MEARIDFWQLACTVHVVMILVKPSHDDRRINRLSTLGFLLITVVPWVVLIGLIWPGK